MTSETVIFQTPRSSITGAPVQQISNLCLAGVSTSSVNYNTNRGKLYGTFTLSGSTYTLNLYSDVTRLDLVAHASSTSFGIVTISDDNNSQLSGSVNMIQYVADDNTIEVLVCLTVDEDVPMNNLETTSDYDNDLGFARFHIEAFEKIKEVLVSRYRSELFDPNWIDSRTINGATGGNNYSKITNWNAFKEAASHYVLYRIAERQSFDGDSIFTKRAVTSKGIYKAHMERTDVVFDTNNTRVGTANRPLSSWKFTRGG